MTLEEKYEKLLAFAKYVRGASCCNVCKCLSCDAMNVLREIEAVND